MVSASKDFYCSKEFISPTGTLTNSVPVFYYTEIIMKQSKDITRLDMLKVWAKYIIPASFRVLILYPKYTYLSFKEDPVLKFLGTLIGNTVFLVCSMSGIIAVIVLLYVLFHKNEYNKRQIFINKITNYKKLL